ncbi:hypothetical protein L227DRAFT_616711 [Lentinus tigrinus ALCF2SS1-6]|uniref:Uncharacterized protein n=1 Tax=Lentinus tigrinus ALCF2SS1-6 TaxID=1328759 RepID=A0A5C2RRQ2_9APHY|nr:hypothetical protein L227DRAFT_616711 [Lentinus tigrinus ALCF2SS1-6]
MKSHRSRIERRGVAACIVDAFSAAELCAVDARRVAGSVDAFVLGRVYALFYCFALHAGWVTFLVAARMKEDQRVAQRRYIMSGPVTVSEQV